MKNLARFRAGGTRTRPMLQIPLPQTPEGRVYRYSPNENAHPRHFVLGNRVEGFEIADGKRSRMRHEPGTPGTICPYSGILADDDAFTHPDDLKAALAIVEDAFHRDVEDQIDQMFSGVAKRSSGFITYKKSGKAPAPRPRFGRRDLMRLLVCDCCGRDYGVFAIALFCPDCGAPNIALHFSREVQLVFEQVELAEGLGKERQELAYRMLGNAHEDVLTAFEATLKTLYLYGKAQRRSDGPAPKVGNDFQNVERGLARFAELGIDPYAGLDADELKALRLNIQKRHVIGHNLGVVDSKFVEEARDARLGETVKLVGADIRKFAELCRKVIEKLDDWLAGQPMPPVDTTQMERSDEEEPAVSEQVGDLSPLAIEIGRWLSLTSERGLPDLVGSEEIIAAFKDAPEVELSDAIAELEADGYLTCSHAIGLRIPHIHSTDDLFLTFDPIVHGSDPLMDALILGELVVDGRESIGMEDLHKESGLPLRRFNPAISLIIAEVDGGRVSGEIGVMDYPTRWFFVLSEDRVSIRRLLQRLRG